MTFFVAVQISQGDCIYAKDSYRYGRNTPTLIFENLEPLETNGLKTAIVPWERLDSQNYHTLPWLTL